ncbi:hypothetical protein YYC_05053 [Plasmodium yoelii 17X]|uniref:Uncharacterized protein n=2 Tax=Plasmodium yoelii TaxID=5861 RepID=Q7RRD3_PLAYO|nr:hypothetical protein [Plasmodium yoelii yoelii]ETB57257.1 hypothetical protein YYC_05053 [Plasmodium yoelii 17X]
MPNFLSFHQFIITGTVHGISSIVKYPVPNDITKILDTINIPQTPSVFLYFNFRLVLNLL